MERVSPSWGENSSCVTLPARCHSVILLERHWVYVSPSQKSCVSLPGLNVPELSSGEGAQPELNRD